MFEFDCSDWRAQSLRRSSVVTLKGCLDQLLTLLFWCNWSQKQRFVDRSTLLELETSGSNTSLELRAGTATSQRLGKPGTPHVSDKSKPGTTRKTEIDFLMNRGGKLDFSCFFAFRLRSEQEPCFDQNPENRNKTASCSLVL